MNRKIIRIALTFFCLALLISASFAQQVSQPASPGNATADRVALYQALLDLTNPWTVMCIAAHPDDEDGTSLIVMRHKYGAHTVSLFSTFGEGGQNAVGPELYEELGAIRARETMAAAEIQGSEPHFLGLKDFGYSKSAEEAFSVWGHDEALRRMVLQIRKLRPDVIITNHSATSNDHGHHQATARLELEAFDAAADPKRFPEQLKDGITAWQVQRLFVRAGRSQLAAPAGQKPDREGGLGSIVTIDPNERDPIRDTTFAEEALRALQKHATQGPWPKTVSQMAARFANSSDGRLPLIRYRLVREAKSADALTKDSHNFLDGLRLSEDVSRRLELLTVNGRPLVEYGEKPSLIFERLVKGLGDGMSSLSPVRSDYRLSMLRGRFWRALSLVAGLKLKVVPFMTVVTPNSNVDLHVTLSNTGTQSVRLIGCGSEILSKRERSDLYKSKGWNYSALTGVDSLASGAVFGTSNRVWFSPKIPVNIPLASHLYEPSGQGVQVNTSCSIKVANSRFNVEEQTRIDVARAVEIAAISPSPIVKTPSDAKTKLRGINCGFEFKVRLINRPFSPFSGELITAAAFGLKASSRSVTISPLAKTDLALLVPSCSSSTDPKKDNERQPNPISLTLVPRGTTKPIARLDVPVVWADASVAANLRVGYVRGFDYSLPNALAALGVASEELSVNEVKTADLQKYTTIIVDNRVYESQPELIAANQKLLDYAKAGGTLVVFYHKSNEWNPDERRLRPQLAPYKLILGDERITDETAPITFIEPQHPLLNFPNKIGQEDFANWIQERGLYYPKDWDANYHALLQSNDPGEAPLKGGLLVADYGRGHYIYTSMVWYRELRAGVPGAYRMLANMISYGKTAP